MNDASNASLAYTFTAYDSLSPTLDRITAANQNLAGATSDASKSTMQQSLAFLTQVGAVTAAYAGMRRLTSSFAELGIISEQDAAAMGRLNAMVGIVVGGFQLLRGAVQIVNSLKAASAALAVVETYRAVLQKGPAAIALAGAGMGIAAGVGGYLLGSTNNNNQTNNFAGQANTNTKTAARESLALMGA